MLTLPTYLRARRLKKDTQIFPDNTSVPHCSCIVFSRGFRKTINIQKSDSPTQRGVGLVCVLWLELCIYICVCHISPSIQEQEPWGALPRFSMVAVFCTFPVFWAPVFSNSMRRCQCRADHRALHRGMYELPPRGKGKLLAAPTTLVKWSRFPQHPFGEQRSRVASVSPSLQISLSWLWLNWTAFQPTHLCETWSP